MKHQLLFLLIFALCTPVVMAQEITLGGLQILNGSKPAPTQPKPASHLKNGNESLKLPFLDDFSKQGPKPDAKLWADRDVYVNTGYAVNPVTIGVATFDALDSTGAIHKDANYKTSVIGDYLTSNKINLAEPGTDNVYLSFYFEPKGKGEMPDIQDSLVLEFLSKNGTWVEQWKTRGKLDTVKFTHVILPVKGADFLTDTFQFRFYNKFSLSSPQVPSLVSNCDHWNIDYVYLNKNRSLTDTIYKDLAFVEPITSVLTNYESIPWHHFLEAKGAATNKSIPFYLRNNGNEKQSIDSKTFTIHDVFGPSNSDKQHTSGQANVAALSNVTFNETYDYDNYSFNLNHKDSATFTITGAFNTDPSDLSQNNTNTYTQRFYDYYAYDDGSAELGYGFVGEGANMARCAYQFTPLVKDTLTAVNICFNRSYLDASKQYFYLAVWDDDNGSPGKLIYKEANYKPSYASQRDSFQTFYLKGHYTQADTGLILSGTYYVGWIQTTADFLNVGFDINRQVNSHIFYNLGYGWSTSTQKGALMVRPMYRKKRVIDYQPEIPASLHSSVYPNPANDVLNIRTESSAPFQLLLLDALGRKLYTGTMKDGEGQINVSGLSSGFYLLKIIGTDRRVETTKVIINR